MARQFDTYIAALTCTRCGEHFAPRQVSYTCPACPAGEGLLDVEFDLGRVHHDFAWSDLVNAPPCMWRYGPLLPVAACHLGREWPIGSTPLYASTTLASFVGIQRLLIKDETRNPNGSIEDRAAGIAAIRAADAGAKTLGTAGAAPWLAAMAAWAAAAAVPAVLFAGAHESPELESQAALFGATVLRIGGETEQVRALCIATCDALGWYCAVDGYNPYLLDGRKTLGLEIAEACMADPPDWIAVGTGQAATIVAIHRALQQMNALELIDWMPRLVSARLDPQDLFAGRARQALLDTNGVDLDVSEKSIAEVQHVAGVRTGLALDRPSASALAVLREAVRQGVIARHETAVLCRTGRSGPLASTAAQSADTVLLTPTLDAVRGRLAR